MFECLSMSSDHTGQLERNPPTSFTASTLTTFEPNCNIMWDSEYIQFVFHHNPIEADQINLPWHYIEQLYKSATNPNVLFIYPIASALDEIRDKLPDAYFPRVMIKNRIALYFFHERERFVHILKTHNLIKSHSFVCKARKGDNPCAKYYNPIRSIKEEDYPQMTVEFKIPDPLVSRYKSGLSMIAVPKKKKLNSCAMIYEWLSNLFH